MNNNHKIKNSWVWDKSIEEFVRSIKRLIKLTRNGKINILHEIENVFINGEIGICECTDHSKSIDKIIPVPYNIEASRFPTTVYNYHNRRYCIFCIERNEYFKKELLKILSPKSDAQERVSK